MKAREYNGKIEILNLRNIITYEKDGSTYHIMPSEYATEESLANELIDAGFLDVIDEPCTENQYLGEVKEVDGKFYRYAIDIPQPSPIDLFDFDTFTKNMREQYEREGKLLRLLQIEPYCSFILMDIKIKAFEQAKVKINARVSLGNFDADDLRIFNDVLMLQNINLSDY